MTHAEIVSACSRLCTRFSQSSLPLDMQDGFNALPLRDRLVGGAVLATCAQMDTMRTSFELALAALDMTDGVA